MSWWYWYVLSFMVLVTLAQASSPGAKWQSKVLVGLTGPLGIIYVCCLAAFRVVQCIWEIVNVRRK